jgi:hypothetical protein
MNRRKISIALMIVALGVPGAAPAAAEAEPDFISVNAQGSVPVAHDASGFSWTADLYSLTTLEKIGTFTDQATCSMSGPPPCLVYDVTTTFRVPGGEVVSRGQWSVSGDSTRPGFAFVASRPEKNTIVSGTGRFAGRAGRVSGWGVADMSGFPSRIGLDVRTFIRFDPTDSGVLGTRELVLADEPPGAYPFQAELFQSEGVNKSEDPSRYVVDNKVFSLSDGSQIGTVVDRFTCGAGPLPCQVLEGTATITYPDGSVTVAFKLPFSPDPGRPGFYLFGARPTEDNIVSATGVYAGKTGRFSASGSVDMRHFPSPVPYEGVGFLVFNK